MLRLLIILVLTVFISGQVATAQEKTPSANPQAVTERCIAKPTEPSDQWRFDGTIITYRNGDGIHGFRADTPSRYYIAFDNDNEYGRFGALSPDGHWFASYLGSMERTNSMMFNNNYFITDIRVVSTLPDRETYTIPFDIYEYSMEASFSPVMWIDNTHFAAHSYYQGSIKDAWYIVNPFTGMLSDLSEADAQKFNELDFWQQSPAWRSDNRFLRLDDAIASGDLPRAFLVPNARGRSGILYVADAESGQIYNTCIETNYSIAVSPTGDQAAVSIGEEDGFVYVVDLNDWAAYRLDLAANSIIAWVADQ